MSSAGALLLFPGAGSSRTHSSLVAIEDALAPLPTVRADFPYRKAGRKVPDRAPVLLDCVIEEARLLAASSGAPPSSIVLGGRSMGGRMCSMAVADGLPAAALVLISYPLHPPGKPDKLRVEHLSSLHLPCLFIHGTNDPFGTPDELSAWTSTIPGPVTHIWVERRGHDLKGSDALIAGTIKEYLSGL